jgi:riboflavin synthase
MFTGIITGVGQIVDSQPLGAQASHGRRLTVQAPAGYLDDVGLGDSIAHNGACMTVTTLDVGASRYTIDVSAESLARTAGLDGLGRVNLEKALRANDRLGGQRGQPDGQQRDRRARRHGRVQHQPDSPHDRQHRIGRPPGW